MPGLWRDALLARLSRLLRPARLDVDTADRLARRSGVAVECMMALSPPEPFPAGCARQRNGSEFRGETRGPE